MKRNNLKHFTKETLLKIKLAFFLASRSIIRGNKKMLVMTMVMMSIACIDLILVSSLLSGVVATMNKQTIDNLYGNILIQPKQDEKYIKQVNNVLRDVRRVPGVLGATPHYVQSAKISYDPDKDGKNVKDGNWEVKSIEVNSEKQIMDIHNSMVSGKYLEDKDRDKIIIGKEISGGYKGSFESSSLGVKVGQKITVRFSNGVEREYTIKGIFNTKSITVDRQAFITKAEMESVLNRHGEATEVAIKLKNSGEETKYISEFKSISDLNGLKIKTWGELNGVANNVASSFDTIKLILSAIGIVVAGITIFIVIYVSLVNRRRQIGILKAIGMEEEIIIISYIFQGIFYAIVGIVVGLLLVKFVFEPYFIVNPIDFPVGWVSLHITKENIFQSIFSIMLVSLFSGYLPSSIEAKETILKLIWGN